MADIRLRNINKEYILKRTQEVDSLEEEIADLQDLVNSPRRIRQVIIGELEQVKKKYALPRRTEIVYDHQTEELLTAEEEVARLPGESLPVPGGISEENHPPVPADVQRAEV